MNTDAASAKRMSMVLGVVAVIVCAKYAYELVYTARYHGTGDFNCFYNGAMVIKEKGDLYDAEVMHRTARQHGSGRINADGQVTACLPCGPPLLYVLFIPLTYLSFRTAAIVWLVLSVGTWFGSVVMIRRLLGLGKDCAFSLLVLVMALNFEPMSTHYVLGQDTALTFLLILSSIVAFRSGHRLVGALAFSGAVLLKLTPVIFLGYFLLKRQYRDLAWALAGVAATAALSLALCGLELNHRCFCEILPGGVALGGMLPENQSICGFLQRLSAMLGMGEQGLIVSRVVSQVLGLVLVAVSGVVMGRKAPQTGRSLAFEISAVLILICLITPITWAHHMVYMFLPFVALLRQEWDAERPLRLKSAVAYCVAYVLIGTLADFYMHPMFQAGPLILVSSAKLYGVVILAALVWAALHCERAQSHTPPAPETLG